MTIIWHIIAAPTTKRSASQSGSQSLSWWQSTAVTMIPAPVMKARAWATRPISQ
ncbi:hypothetical protein D3C76_1679960 [compost metagenome]